MADNFQPDYRNILEVLFNRRPARLPLYEHHIDVPFISKFLNREIILEGDKPADYEQYYRTIVNFWKDMTYDAFDFEAAICDIFPDHGAINGGRPGPIQTMDDLINAGIDAKHSNEDQIAPFEKWIELYNERIGLFGGIDVNVLTLNGYDEVYRIVLEKGTEFRKMAKGYGIGSGNSIPGYVPPESFKAMVDAAGEIRRRET